MYKLSYCVLILLLTSCSHSTFRSKWTKEKAPASFTARFETSKGNFDVEVTKDLSPLAADRFYQLVRHHYFDKVLFYRVVPGFVAQFGNIDTTFTKKWEQHIVKDEPVVAGNLKGTISFARSVADSRGVHLFINLNDNKRLDTTSYSGVTGFPVFGKVSNGMDVVESLYNGYSNATMEISDSLGTDKVKFLALFPKLDSIKRAYIITTRKK